MNRLNDGHYKRTSSFVIAVLLIASVTLVTFPTALPSAFADSTAITVTKVVVNNNGGTKTASDFPLFLDLSSVTSGVQNTVIAGTHTVSETSQTGYTATISGDCAADGSITLNSGDHKSCTITNDDAGGGSSGDTTPPSINRISFFSVQGGTQTEGFVGRLLGYYNNIPIQIMHTGEEEQFQVSVSDNSGIASIKKVVVNFFFDYNLLQKSDTYFIYDETKQELTVSDPLGIFGDVQVHRTFTATEMVLTFTFTPQKPLDPTDVVIIPVDEYLNNQNTIIPDAFKIVGAPVASLEEETVEAEIPYYKNPEWNQFVIDSDGNMMTYDAFGNLDTKPMRVIAPPVYYGDDIGKSERHDDDFYDKVLAEEDKAREIASAIMKHPIYSDGQKIFKSDKIFKYPSNVGKADRSDVKSMNDLKQKEHSKAMKLAKRMS